MVLQQPSPYELVIGGMTCAARVQAKLNRLDGVTAAVNVSTERAWVSAPPNLSPRDLEAVPDAIALARATCTTIRRNLAWAFCYSRRTSLISDQPAPGSSWYTIVGTRETTDGSQPKNHCACSEATWASPAAWSA